MMDTSLLKQGKDSRLAGQLDRLRGLLPTLVLILCVIQPVLDVIGYWQVRLSISNTVTMLVRMLLLAGTVLLGFALSDRKRYYYGTLGVLAVLTLLHALACMRSPRGYHGAVTDLINLVRIYFLPLMTLCFITFLRQNDRVLQAMKLGMVIDVLLIAAVQLVSTITGTDPHTYSVDGTGILGWFMWTNSQSAILGMLCPIVICWSIRRWEGKILPVALVTVISEATLYVLAPRLSYASLIGAGLGVGLLMLILERRRWKQAVTVLLITALFVAAYPISPTHARLDDNAVRMQQARKDIEERNIVIHRPTDFETTLMTDSELSSGAEETLPTVTEAGENGEIILDEETASELEKLYRSRYIIWSMVTRFGRDKVFKIYDYTLDPEILSSTRIMKINFCRLLMDEADFMGHLFGLNLNDMSMQRYDKDSVLVTDVYDVENDFHGVYFLTGLVGLVLMLLFLLYFGLRALVYALKKPKERITLELMCFGMAYGIGLIHAYNTASVLRRNNASIYLALVLAGLWYLTRKEADHDRKPELPK